MDTCYWLETFIMNDENFQVDAVQACGGQMTANGKRLRTGGGLLWNIIKAREPKAYKEIMKKAREFEVHYQIFFLNWLYCWCLI